MKEKDFKSGMFVEFETGCIGLCLETNGGLSIVGGDGYYKEYFPVRDQFLGGVLQPRRNNGHVVKVYHQTHNRHISDFFRGKLDTSELEIFWKRDDKSAELKKVINDLEKQLAEAQKKLANIK